MFGLSPHISGMLAGLIVGFIMLLILRSLAKYIDEKAKTEEHRHSARLLRTLSVVDVFVFIAFGYFVGPLVFV